MSTRTLLFPRRTAVRERPFVQPLAGRSATAAMIVNTNTGVPLAMTVEAAFDSASRKRGLLGRDGLARRHAVVIAPTNAIHTFFMRFPIDVVFVARDGRVVKVSDAVKPWRITLAVTAFCVIELPAHAAAVSRTRAGDRLELFPAHPTAAADVSAPQA